MANQILVLTLPELTGRLRTTRPRFHHHWQRGLLILVLRKPAVDLVIKEDHDSTPFPEVRHESQ